MRGILLVGLVAGACSQGRAPGSPGSPGGDGPDAGTGSDGGMQGPAHITIMTGQPPALILYRDQAATAWNTPANPSTGQFEFDAAGPYLVIIACGDSDSRVLVSQLARTPDDEHMIEHACGAPALPFRVRGQMLQEGQVDFGGAGLGESSVPWSFELPIAAGTFDFVAYFGDLVAGFDQIEIRRDIPITGDLDLGTIDVAHESTQALVATAFTASNLAANESLAARTSLQSGNTFALDDLTAQHGSTWQVNLVPVAALRPTDTLDVELSAESLLSTQPMQIGERSVTRRVRDGGSTSVVLMDWRGPATFESTTDRLVATWASLPAYDQLDVVRDSFSSAPVHSVTYEFSLSHAFITATGVTSATLDFTDVPGFQPGWHQDPALQQSFSLALVRGTLPDDHMFAEVVEEHPAPTPLGVQPPRVNAPRRAPARARRPTP